MAVFNRCSMYVSVVVALTSIAFPFIHAAYPREMKNMMKHDVKPCHDFYEYACGGWKKANRIGASDSILISSKKSIDDYNNKIVQKIVKKRHIGLDRIWDSCMARSKESKDQGNRPLKEDLHRIASAPTKDDLLTLAGEFSRTGTNAFLRFMSNVNSRRREVINVLVMRPAELTLPSLMHYDGATFERLEHEYRLYISELMELSGMSKDHHDVSDTVIQIELKLRHHIADKSPRTEQVEMYQAKLRKWPLTLKGFLKGLNLQKDVVSPAIHKIYLKIVDLEYMEGVEEWLKDASIDDLKAYLSFVMVHSRVGWLGKSFSDIKFKFFGQVLQGIVKPPSLASVCMNDLVQYVHGTFAKEYYLLASDKEREKDVTYMVSLFKETIKEQIHGAPWLDANTKGIAVRKADNLMSSIGEPRLRTHPYWSSLSSDDYYTNMFTILDHSFGEDMTNIFWAPPRNDWPHSSAAAKAYYVPEQNAIRLSTAILQPPLFDGDKIHPARNFGGLGTVIGHEITHGFDSIGHHYDLDGTERNWWKESIVSAFHTQNKCLERLYSTFEVHGERGRVLGRVNGKLTLDENFADNNGLTLAWKAYRKYMTSGHPKLKGWKDDGDQMFFIAYGQNWCMNARDNVMLDRLHTETTSPGKWRVNGAVMNNKYFATVFHCDDETPMNPISKCPIW